MTSLSEPQTLTSVCALDCAAPRFQRRYCDRRRTVVIQRSPLVTREVPCRNYHHSVQDFKWWARLMAGCLQLSWAELPPHGTLRITAYSLDDDSIDRVERKFIGRLRRRGVSYAWFREWTSPGSGRHLHLAVRASSFDLTDVGRLWEDSLAGADGSSYSAEITNSFGLARYLTGDCYKRIVLPPADCRYIFGARRGFLVRPLAKLKKEVKAAWRARRLARDGAALPVRTVEHALERSP